MATTATKAVDEAVMMAAAPRASISDQLRERLDREHRAAAYARALELRQLEASPVDVTTYVGLLEQTLSTIAEGVQSTADLDVVDDLERARRAARRPR